MSIKIAPEKLREWILDDKELALIDVREEGQFSTDGHLLFAVCLPLSHLELKIFSLVPRKSVRVVLCDGDNGFSEIAAKRLLSWGYNDVSILDGGAEGWLKAGNVLFRGVNVPSKAFGEFVEHDSGTPSISPENLKSMIDSGDDILVLDSRPFSEFKRMNIPTAVNCPGVELPYRIYDFIKRPETTVVVNCAGRTRSIIGAQSLINVGVKNKVVALQNGTMGWSLAGYDLEHGADRSISEKNDNERTNMQGIVKSLVERFGISKTKIEEIDSWNASDQSHSLFLLDVRTYEEYLSGHILGSVHAPGGQLVQAIDRWVGVQGARLVLIDDTGLRATMTASWLIQMGWKDVHVLANVDEVKGLKIGHPSKKFVPPKEKVQSISLIDAKRAMKHGAVFLDFSTSLEYKAGHIEGSFWVVRSRLAEALSKFRHKGVIICTSPDGHLATYSASDLSAILNRTVLFLEGGTEAWIEAGFPIASGFENLTTENNDIQYKAYDYDKDIEFHMREYISWEVGLFDLVKKDGTAQFRHFSE